MKGLPEMIARLVFPPRCAVCAKTLAMKEWKDGLCTACKEHIPYLAAESCLRCGAKTERNGLCGDCLRTFAFEGFCAAFPYRDVRKAIHLFKYKGAKEFGRGLGLLMADYLRQSHGWMLSQTDVVMPVPLHPKKEKRRGFNQTMLLCRTLSEETGLPVMEHGLTRKRDTVAQSRLSAEERKRNLKDVFEAAADVEGKRILLVDDIFTTGATCNECARALYRAGAAWVGVFCLSAA